MRTLTILIALALSACSTSIPVVPMSASNQGTFSGFASLAVLGTWESEIAPAYTRLAALRHRAAGLLNKGRISTDSAAEVQRLADTAREYLDQSRLSPATKPTYNQRLQLNQAIDAIAAGEKLIKDR
jgi:hypothetical protein